ncbi:MAG: hypothetical protein ACRC57_13730 [Sarcina sp.]
MKISKTIGSEVILVGNAGCGKTTFIGSLMSSNSSEILDKYLAGTICLEVQTKFVFTNSEEFDDKVRIALKKRKYIFNIENLYKASLSAIENITKCTSFKSDKHAFDLFLSYMKEECLRYDKSFSLIDKDIFDDSIYNISIFFKELVTVDRIISRSIEVKNRYRGNGKLIDKTRFSNSMKLCIQREIENLNLAKQSLFKKVINKFNYELSSAFYKYFSKDKVSSDGYHYIDIKQKINGDLYILNNLYSKDLGGSKSSNENILLNSEIRALCSFSDEVIIYVAVHEKIAKMINSNNKSGYLENEKGEIYFSILDTKGLLPNEKSEEDIKSIIYNESYDSIIFMKSILDTNSKIDSIIDDAIDGINKDIPVFVVNSKVDLLIDNYKKQHWNKTKSKLDYFEMIKSMEDNSYSFEDTFDYSMATDFIDSIIQKQQDYYNKVQKKKKYKKDVHVLASMGVLDYEKPIFVQNKYYMVSVISKIFRVLIKKHENDKRILATIIDAENSFSSIKIDVLKDVVSELVAAEFKSEKGLDRIKNIIDNINFNYGVNPNEVSYEMARKKLSYADKYMACLDRDFCDYNPFDWTFPVKFREELINEFFIRDIIKNAVSLKNCDFEENGYKKFFKEVEVYKKDIARKLSVIIMHDVILLESEYENMFNTYKIRYNEYLFKLKTSIYSERIKAIIEENIDTVLQDVINIVIKKRVYLGKC